jgi:hypothetical protein
VHFLRVHLMEGGRAWDREHLPFTVLILGLLLMLFARHATTGSGSWTGPSRRWGRRPALGPVGPRRAGRPRRGGPGRRPVGHWAGRRAWIAGRSRWWTARGSARASARGRPGVREGGEAHGGPLPAIRSIDDLSGD